MPDYQLTMSAKQAAAVSHALELYSRIGIGQVDTVADEYFDHPKYMEIREALEGVRVLVTGHRGASLGITNARTPVEAKICWEVYQVIRQILAFARNPAGGHSVDFQDPLAISGEPLPAIQATDETRDCRPTSVRMCDELKAEIGTNDIGEALKRIKSWKKAAISPKRSRKSKLIP